MSVGIGLAEPLGPHRQAVRVDATVQELIGKRPPVMAAPAVGVEGGDCAGVRSVRQAEPQIYGRPACGTSTIAVNRTASRASRRWASRKSGAAQTNSVRPSSPPNPQA